MKNELIKLEKTKMNLETKHFGLSLNVDSSALYETNAREYFRTAMIGENSTRSNFKMIMGVKDREKIGEVIAANLLRKGTANPNFADTEVKQELFEVCDIQVATLIDIDALESSFISNQINKGANNYTDTGAFFNFFYETLASAFSEELEYLTWRGDLDGFSPAIEYLEVCDGLEKKLGASADTIKPLSPSVVTANNVIDKMKEARDNTPLAVRIKSDFVYMVSANVYDALMDAVSENKNSGLYFIEKEELKFQGVQVFRAEGANDDVIVAGQWSNFLYILDGISDDTAFTVVDFLKTTLTRRLGMRTDIKFSVDVMKYNEVYFHKPA